MRVDNKASFFSMNGAEQHVFPTDDLRIAQWRPVPPGTFKKPPVVQGTSQAAAKKVQAYRPPGASRLGGGSLAAELAREKQAENAPAVQRAAAAYPPGYTPAEPQKSKSQLANERKKKAKEAARQAEEEKKT